MITKGEIIDYIDEIIEDNKEKTIPEQAGAYYAALSVVRIHLKSESIANTFENTWVNKVEQEKMEICNRICNLTNFLKDTKNIDELSPHMLYLLSEQLRIMNQYHYILEERIKEGEKNDLQEL